MKLVWIGAAAVSIAAHGSFAAWVDGRELPKRPSPPPIAMQLTAPPKPPHVEPPPPPPPPPPREKKPVVVKKLAPVEPPPPEAPKVGIAAEASAGDIAVPTGVTTDGELGTGTAETPAPPPPAPPPPPPPPAKRYVPIYQVTRLPAPKRAVAPEVPEAFRQAQREALVVVEVEIDAAGHVTGARVLRHAEFGLDDAALAAARQTEFEPALVGTQPVPVRYQIPYRFRVRG